ncbi:unnamed protein product [Vitrella brassicaformis CCMP3155]|uniref:UDENN domain-containing protein n=1 Tax=Vitrella brassicaformis (strain CCMP3155) TaxID=1169540 RepID=A0A0G4ED14_VITBC|nr:unnamed protein product [Vitrella brassicaformis CCMP3155]|eukprot:CEL93567.1 unnamed protein product [Vitrella brassicaformis CCMP3155]
MHSSIFPLSELWRNRNPLSLIRGVALIGVPSAVELCGDGESADGDDSLLSEANSGTASFASAAVGLEDVLASMWQQQRESVAVRGQVMAHLPNSNTFREQARTLPQLCFPHGLKIVRSAAPPPNRQACVVLGDIATQRTYVSLYIQYLPCKQLEQEQQEHDAATADGNSSSSSVLYLPLVLCLLSHVNALHTLRRLLHYVWHHFDEQEQDEQQQGGGGQAQTDGDGAYGLWYRQKVAGWVACLHWLLDVPSPAPGTSVVMHIDDGSFGVEQPFPWELPLCDLPMQLLFRCLSVSAVYFLMKLLLLERKVVLASRSAHLLTCAAETAKALLYPFHWQHSYMPIVHRAELLEAPPPFFYGYLKTPGAHLPHTFGSAISFDGSPQCDYILFDLDGGAVVSPPGQPALADVPSMPKRAENDLIGALQAVCMPFIDRLDLADPSPVVGAASSHHHEHVNNVVEDSSPTHSSFAPSSSHLGSPELSPTPAAAPRRRIPSAVTPTPSSSGRAFAEDAYLPPPPPLPADDQCQPHFNAYVRLAFLKFTGELLQDVFYALDHPPSSVSSPRSSPRPSLPSGLPAPPSPPSPPLLRERSSFTDGCDVVRRGLRDDCRGWGAGGGASEFPYESFVDGLMPEVVPFYQEFFRTNCWLAFLEAVTAFRPSSFELCLHHYFPSIYPELAATHLTQVPPLPPFPRPPSMKDDHCDQRRAGAGSAYPEGLRMSFLKSALAHGRRLVEREKGDETDSRSTPPSPPQPHVTVTRRWSSLDAFLPATPLPPPPSQPSWTGALLLLRNDEPLDDPISPCPPPDPPPRVELHLFWSSGDTEAAKQKRGERDVGRLHLSPRKERRREKDTGGGEDDGPDPLMGITTAARDDPNVQVLGYHWAPNPPLPLPSAAQEPQSPSPPTRQIRPPPPIQIPPRSPMAPLGGRRQPRRMERFMLRLHSSPHLLPAVDDTTPTTPLPPFPVNNRKESLCDNLPAAAAAVNKRGGQDDEHYQHPLPHLFVSALRASGGHLRRGHTRLEALDRGRHTPEDGRAAAEASPSRSPSPSPWVRAIPDLLAAVERCASGDDGGHQFVSVPMSVLGMACHLMERVGAEPIEVIRLLLTVWPPLPSILPLWRLSRLIQKMSHSESSVASLVTLLEEIRALANPHAHAPPSCSSMRPCHISSAPSVRSTAMAMAMRVPRLPLNAAACDGTALDHAVQEEAMQIGEIVELIWTIAVVEYGPKVHQLAALAREAPSSPSPPPLSLLRPSSPISSPRRRSAAGGLGLGWPGSETSPHSGGEGVVEWYAFPVDSPVLNRSRMCKSTSRLPLVVVTELLLSAAELTHRWLEEAMTDRQQEAAGRDAEAAAPSESGVGFAMAVAGGVSLPESPRATAGERRGEGWRLKRWREVQNDPDNQRKVSSLRIRCAELQRVDPSTLTHDERLAFWLNAHNLGVLLAVCVRPFPYGFLGWSHSWTTLLRKSTLDVDGCLLSLLDIEHLILRTHTSPPAANNTSSKLWSSPRGVSRDARRKHALESADPLVPFGLFFPVPSSPPLRIFTAALVHHQLAENTRMTLVQSTTLTGLENGQERSPVGGGGCVTLPKLMVGRANDLKSTGKLIEWVADALDEAGPLGEFLEDAPIVLCEGVSITLQEACTRVRESLLALTQEAGTSQHTRSRLRVAFHEMDWSFPPPHSICCPDLQTDDG